MLERENLDCSALNIPGAGILPGDKKPSAFLYSSSVDSGKTRPTGIIFNATRQEGKGRSLPTFSTSSICKSRSRAPPSPGNATFSHESAMTADRMPRRAHSLRSCPLQLDIAKTQKATFEICKQECMLSAFEHQIHHMYADSKVEVQTCKPKKRHVCQQKGRKRSQTSKLSMCKHHNDQSQDMYFKEIKCVPTIRYLHILATMKVLNVMTSMQKRFFGTTTHTSTPKLSKSLSAHI